MRKFPFIVLTLVLLCAFTACEQVDPLAPVETGHSTGFEPARAAIEAVGLAQWPVLEGPAAAALVATAPQDPADALITNVVREVLFADVVHTSFDVAVGPGPWDVIRLHRVVREGSGERPLAGRNNIFLLHGDGVGFVKFVFGSATPELSDDMSAAVFLAQNGVDVWGMDQNWAIVPAGLGDYSFAADWGMQNQVDNLQAGIAVARNVRALTGGGPQKMNVLGYSSGGFTVYALADQETQVAPAFRQMGGMIIADSAYKLDRAIYDDNRIGLCGYYDYYLDLLQNGEFDLGFGFFFQTMGELAVLDPDGPSPLVPGLTNLQTAVVVGAAPDPTGFSPWYHYFGGVFDGDLPVDFAFSRLPAVLDFYQSAADFEPTAFAVDYTAVACDQMDVPFDDHLGEVRIPTFLLGAAGGFGVTGLYSLDLLGSSDVSSHIVSLTGVEETDFAHIDLWTADNARDVAWKPLLQWLDAHVPTAGGPVKWQPATGRF